MADIKNHLGLDKYQVTVIKSNYNSTKPIRKLVEKAEAKIKVAEEKRNAAIKAAQDKYEESVKDLATEMQAYKEQINILDKFSMDTTKHSCGVELTSEQVIKFLDDEEAFKDFLQEKNGNSMFDGKDDKEEDFPNDLPETQEPNE